MQTQSHSTDATKHSHLDDLDGLALRDFLEAKRSLDETSRIRAWWTGAPPPAWDAFVISCIARGNGSPHEITKLTRLMAGREAANAVADTVFQPHVSAFWTALPSGRLQLTGRGLRAIHAAHVATA